MEFKVTATSGALEEITVEYTVSVGEGDTATAPTDFASDAVMTGTVTFAAGATGDALTVTVSVATRDDGDDENNETFTLKLLNASSNATIDPERGSAVGTILDNDGPPSLSVAPAMPEGSTEGSMVDFTVTLTLASDMARNEPVSVSVRDRASRGR